MSICDPCCDNAQATFPNLIGINCLEIDKTDPNEWVISTECNPTVVSNDDSVNISLGENIQLGVEYDLSVTCCDELVGACDGDTHPGFIGDKIKVESGGPLTRTLNNCPGDGHWTLGFNQGALTLPDEKVAVSSGATAGYLPQVLTFDSCMFKTSIQNNVMVVEDDCDDATSLCMPQTGKIRLVDTVIVTQTAGPTGVGDEKFYLLSGVPFTGAGLINANLAPELLHGITEIYGGLQVNRKGLYRISMRGNFETSRGIHAERILLWLAPTGGTARIILEQRMSGVAGSVDPHSPDVRPPEAYKTQSGGEIPSDSESLGSHLARVGFSDSDIFELNAGDRVFFGFKLSSIMSNTLYNSGTPAEFAILGTLGAAAGGDIGMSFSINSIDNFCIANSL